MKKALSISLAALMLVTSLFGCAPAAQSNSQSSDSQQSSQSSADSSEPDSSEPEQTIFIDELGREVIIPENPQKILALTSTVMTAVYNLDLPLVGKVEEYKVTEEGMALPSVGQTQAVNIEAIYALEPDLIIASSRFHAALEEELVGTGAAVVFFDPDGAGEIPIVELTPYVGKILHEEAAAEAYAQSVFALADDLAAQVKELHHFETGVMLQGSESVTAAQSASGFGSMLTLLGIENIVPKDLPNAKKASFVAYDIEQIVADDPDVVFLIPTSKEPEANKQMLQEFKNDETWSQLSAVQNDTVFVVPFQANPNRSAPADMLQLIADLLLTPAK